MNSFEHERQPDRQPCLYYLPVDDYSSEFQQLSVLQQRGYPIEMTVIPNDDEGMHAYFAQFSRDETMEKEAPLYPQWAKFTVDPEFDRIIVHPSTPGDTPQIDDVDDEHINGEQVAGLVSNYYNLVEQHFPEFKDFSS